MAGIELTIEVADLDAINAQLLSLDSVIPDMLPSLAVLVESQTRRRIAEEQTGPDGKPWPAWSLDYAMTRRPGQSLLMASGDMLDSIAGEVTANDAITVGSDKVQAALMQFGGTANMAAGPAAVPARPFLGLSDDNLNEVADLVSLAVREHMQ